MGVVIIDRSIVRSFILDEAAFNKSVEERFVALDLNSDDRPLPIGAPSCLLSHSICSRHTSVTTLPPLHPENSPLSTTPSSRNSTAITAAPSISKSSSPRCARHAHHHKWPWIGPVPDHHQGRWPQLSPANR